MNSEKAEIIEKCVHCRTNPEKEEREREKNPAVKRIYEVNCFK